MGSTTSRMRVEKMIVAGAIAVGLAAGTYGIASAGTETRFSSSPRRTRSSTRSRRFAPVATTM